MANEHKIGYQILKQWNLYSAMRPTVATLESFWQLFTIFLTTPYQMTNQNA